MAFRHMLFFSKLLIDIGDIFGKSDTYVLMVPKDDTVTEEKLLLW